jgi:hypothetical protein
MLLAAALKPMPAVAGNSLALQDDISTSRDGFPAFGLHAAH